MSLQLRQKITDFLKQHPNQRFKAKEIAQWVFITYPEECEKKRLASKATKAPLNTNEAFIAQLVAEIGSSFPDIQRKFPAYKRSTDKPFSYYFDMPTIGISSNTQELISPQNLTKPKRINKQTKGKIEDEAQTEKMLYPLLATYLRQILKLYSKRIDETHSSRGEKGSNKWLFPDVVSLEIIGHNWCSEVTTLVKQYSDRRTKLWSFEVKKKITRANVRESFFQAVSNSSWANFAYLVASNIDNDAMEELSILSSLHGVGVIRLNEETPEKSTIMIHAKERLDVDWNVANRLTEENRDFGNYIRLIREFYQTDSLKEHEWGIK